MALDQGKQRGTSKTRSAAPKSATSGGKVSAKSAKPVQSARKLDVVRKMSLKDTAKILLSIMPATKSPPKVGGGKHSKGPSPENKLSHAIVEKASKASHHKLSPDNPSSRKIINLTSPFDAPEDFTARAEAAEGYDISGFDATLQTLVLPENITAVDKEGLQESGTLEPFPGLSKNVDKQEITPPLKTMVRPTGAVESEYKTTTTVNTKAATPPTVSAPLLTDEETAPISADASTGRTFVKDGSFDAGTGLEDNYSTDSAIAPYEEAAPQLEDYNAELEMDSFEGVEQNESDNFRTKDVPSVSSLNPFQTTAKKSEMLKETRRKPSMAPMKTSEIKEGVNGDYSELEQRQASTFLDESEYVNQDETKYKDTGSTRTSQSKYRAPPSNDEESDLSAKTQTAESSVIGAIPQKKHPKKYMGKIPKSYPAVAVQPIRKQPPREKASLVNPPHGQTMRSVAKARKHHKPRKDSTEGTSAKRSPEATANNFEVSSESEEFYREDTAENIERYYDSEPVRRDKRTTESRRKYAGKKARSTGGKSRSSHRVAKGTDRSAVLSRKKSNEWRHFGEERPRSRREVETSTCKSCGSCWPSHMAERRSPARSRTQEYVRNRLDLEPDDYRQNDGPSGIDWPCTGLVDSDRTWIDERQRRITTVAPCCCAPWTHGLAVPIAASELEWPALRYRYPVQALSFTGVPIVPIPSASLSQECLCRECHARRSNDYCPPSDRMRLDDLLRHEERMRQEERMRHAEQTLREEKIRQDERMRLQQERLTQEEKLRNEQALHEERRRQLEAINQENLRLQEASKREKQEYIRVLQKERLRLQLLREERQRLQEQRHRDIQLQRCILRDRRHHDNLEESGMSLHHFPEEPRLTHQSAQQYENLASRDLTEKRLAERRAQELIKQGLAREALRLLSRSVRDDVLHATLDQRHRDETSQTESREPRPEARRWNDVRRCSDAGASEESWQSPPPPRRRGEGSDHGML